MIVMVNPIQALWFIVFLLCLQQIEGNLIYPHVVGSSVGLPGIWVLAAVTVGGGLLGIGGMLFAVPLCSVLYALSRLVVRERLRAKGASVDGLPAVCGQAAAVALSEEGEETAHTPKKTQKRRTQEKLAQKTARSETNRS